VELVGGAVRQQEPPGGEVIGRVARAEVAEVDHTAEGAAGGEDVGRVQVGVNPQRRARPSRRGDRVVPDGADRVRVVDQASFGGGGKPFGELVGAVGQWAAAVPALRRAGGGGPVQGPAVISIST